MDEPWVSFEYETQNNRGASGHVTDGEGYNIGVASVTCTYRVQVYEVVRIRLFPVSGRPMVVGELESGHVE